MSVAHQRCYQRTDAIRAGLVCDADALGRRPPFAYSAKDSDFLPRALEERRRFSIKESRRKFVNAPALQEITLRLLEESVRMGLLMQPDFVIRQGHQAASPQKRLEEAPNLAGRDGCLPLMCGSVQHVDAFGVHMLGHLKYLVELVIQGRLRSRSRQRVVTGSKGNLVCAHNEYFVCLRTGLRNAPISLLPCPKGAAPKPFRLTPWLPWREGDFPACRIAR